MSPLWRKKGPKEVFDENMKKAKKLYGSPKRWEPSRCKKLLEHIEKAQETAETVEVDQEDIVWLWSVKGSVFYMGYHRLDEALECYGKALSINPGHLVTLGNRLQVLNAMGKRDEFLKDCDKALELILEARKQTPEGQGPSIPGRPPAPGAPSGPLSGVEFLDYTESLLWDQKGNALRDLDRTKEALVCFDRALEINPKNWLPLRDKGSALCGLRRYEEAMEHINKSIEYGPKHRGVPSDVATLLEKVRVLGNLAGRDLYELSEQRPDEWAQKEGKVETMHKEIDQCLAWALDLLILGGNADGFLRNIVELGREWESRGGPKVSVIDPKRFCKICNVKVMFVTVAPLYWGKSGGWGFWHGGICPHNKMGRGTSIQVIEGRREELAKFL